MDITGLVLGVQGRTTRNNKTIYDVEFQPDGQTGQTYTTFDGALAQKAGALTGQRVSARIEITQNGQYTNYNISDIALEGQLPPLAMPVPGGTPVNIPIQASPADRVSDVERQKLIVRQSVLSTAFRFTASFAETFASQADAEQAALGLAGRLYDRVFAVPQPPVPQTPAEVAQIVNAEVPGAVQVGAPTPAW